MPLARLLRNVLNSVHCQGRAQFAGERAEQTQ